MNLNGAQQQFARRLPLKVFLLALLLASNPGFAQVQQHVLNDEMDSALSMWTDALTPADTPCKTKLVKAPPKLLRPVIASYRTSCSVHRSKGSFERERSITVMLHQVTWKDLPISKYFYSQGYDSATDIMMGNERKITIDVPFAEARKTIESWWTERQLEVVSDAPGISASAGDSGDESLAPDEHDARKSIFTHSFSE